MAVYYLDGTTLSNSTAVYDDEELTICAADGYYSNGAIVRQLLNCALQSSQACTGSLSCPQSYDVCYSSISAADLCCVLAIPSTIWISDDYTFENAPHFYTDSTLSIVAPTGWYSNDIPGGCAVIPKSLQVCYSSVSEDDLCCVSPVAVTVWIYDQQNFENAPMFYTDNTLTTEAADGWYSNDLNPSCII